MSKSLALHSYSMNTEVNESFVPRCPSCIMRLQTIQWRVYNVFTDHICRCGSKILKHEKLHMVAAENWLLCVTDKCLTHSMAYNHKYSVIGNQPKMARIKPCMWACIITCLWCSLASQQNASTLIRIRKSPCVLSFVGVWNEQKMNSPRIYVLTVICDMKIRLEMYLSIPGRKRWQKWTVAAMPCCMK